MPKDIFKLVLSVAACLIIGFAGSLVTTPSINTWYAGLQKPFFNPPNWIFGPVWTTLYVMMGIAIYLVLREGLAKSSVRKALKLFLTQIVLNFFWSFFFFGLRMPIVALIEIIILWIAIFLTIKAFKPISKTASFLMIPYLLWVSFATILNLFIVILN